MAEPQDKQKEQIDALGHLADETKQQAPAAPPAEQLAALEAQAAEAAKAVEAGETPQAEALAEVPEPRAPAPGHAAQAAAYRHRSRAAHADQFKRTMIPLLVVVGGLLLALSVVTLALMVSTADRDEFHMQTETSALSIHGRWAVPLAVPLGVILLAAAWLFHRDLRRGQR